MKLFVNESEIPFQSEGETSLDQVLESLDRWLDTQGWVRTAVSVNGQPEEEETALPLTKVDLLEVRAWPRAAKELLVVGEYLELLMRILESGDRERLEEALADFTEVAAALPRLLRPIGNRVDAAYTVMDTWVTAPWDQKKSGLMALRLLRQECRNLQEELLTPGPSFERTLQTLRHFFPLLEEVPLQFQLGKDTEALNSVLSLLNLLEDLVRQAGLVSDFTDQERQEFRKTVEEVNGFLKDLQGAFEAKDMVMISDLLEYEITPRLLTLTQGET